MSKLGMIPYSLLVLAVACSPEAGPPRAAGNAVWFEGARLIVGDGNAPIENSAFLVEDGVYPRRSWAGTRGTGLGRCPYRCRWSRLYC